MPSSSRVCVGIHVHAEPERLRATLAALERTRRPRLELLLLPDGPDPGTAAALAALPHARSGTPTPAGPPACFNRLAGETDADVLVFLESGAVPAPGALRRLVDALQGSVGLAGPSTNSAWNEQCAFPGGDDVERTGRLAARRFGDATRSLAPLHALADFCFAVRRDVVEAIGAADEGYGLGPCWEMEYCVRAARAGFEAVWVQGAYVWRPPFTARRAREERRLFETSRRRYQDSVCGLRLRGERGPYRSHCLGDECEHFAPRSLLRLERPLATAPAAPPRPAERPLVSCLMPTRNRADFALQAVRLFLRQDYEPRELVVVDDGDDGLERLLPDDGRIRYLRAPRGETIGGKRNRACAAARGDYLAQWDDDDWYAPGRLSAQVAPLLAGRADVTGLVTPLFFELDSWTFWSVTPELHRRLFFGDVHGGTLVYARRVWEQLARYPNLSLAEDASFLQRALQRGARLERVEGTGLFVYLRHAGNAWRFTVGAHVDPGGWRAAPEPPFPDDDREFYARRSAAAPSPPSSPEPLVSCVMATYERPHLVPGAIACFLRQDFPSAELVVVDDGARSVASLLPEDDRVRYIHLRRRHTIGAKRNVGCEAARADLLANWDDDDWYAPWRLRYQVESLTAAAAEVCGLSRLLYLQPSARRAWRYAWPETARPWVADAVLLYTRDFWRRNPFPDTSMGIDCRLLWTRSPKRILALPDERFFVGVIHDRNTSPKNTSHSLWSPHPLEDVEALLGEDAAFYTGA